MNNLEVYSVALNSAPYVAAAYGLIWATLCIYIGFIFRRLTRLEKELAVVESSIGRRQDAPPTGAPSSAAAD